MLSPNPNESKAHQIAPASRGDLKEIAVLARIVWQATYPGIIGQAQIEYMLRQRYGLDHLRTELDTPGIWWDTIRMDGELAGFASTVLMPGGRELKLDKLYIDPRRQRNGLGSLLIAQALQRAREQRCSALILAVNKRNGQALAAYAKHGFSVREFVSVDIGDGFVMDDFIMAKSLD